MHDNDNDEQKQHLKMEDNKRKTKRDNLNVDEKEQLRKYDKKGKKAIPDNLGDVKKEQVRKDDKKRKMSKPLQTLDERNSIFNNVQMCSKFDTSILTTPVFRLNEEDFKSTIQEGRTYICDICCRFEFRRNVIKLKEPKYQTDIYNGRTTGKSDWTCKSCLNSMLKNKMPIHAQLNSIELCPKFSELNRLCPIELMLISDI